MNERPTPNMEQSLDWNEGVASERTLLAWERTAVASIGVAVLVVRAGIVEGLLTVAIPVAALLVLAGVFEWIYSLRIYGAHGHPNVIRAVLQSRAIFALGAITLLAAAGCVALVVR